MQAQRTEVFQKPERFYPSLQHNTFRCEELVVVPWQVPDRRTPEVGFTEIDQPPRSMDMTSLLTVASSFWLEGSS
jgi:hypothetical protein